MRTFLLFLSVLACSVSSAWAGPQILNYQGSLSGAGGSSVPDGTYRMRFRLYAAQSGGSNLWSETDTAVEVHDGLFSTILGDGTAFGAVFDNDTLYLEIAVDTSKNSAIESSEIFAPRQRMTSAAWAVNSDRLGTRAAANYEPRQHEAVVAPSGGDYTTIQAALEAGKKSIFVRNGTYVLSSNIVITQDGTHVVGESREGVVIDCNETSFGIRVVGDTAAYGAGSISVACGSDTVVGASTAWSSNVVAGDYILLKLTPYRIASVASDTAIILERQYMGPALAAGSQYSIASLVDRVVIESLTVRNRTSLTNDGAIDLEWAVDCSVRDCCLENNIQNGIFAANTYECEIEGNSCHSNWVGIYARSGAGIGVSGNECTRNANEGIYFYDVVNGLVSGNKCASNGNGIEINGNGMQFGRRTAVSGNVCQGNIYDGICIAHIPSCVVSGNSCGTNGYDGIYLYQAHSASITGNTCPENINSGINLNACSSPAVSGNSCFANSYDGIRLTSSSYGTITGNSCAGNMSYGINLTNGGCDHNIVGMNMLALNVVAGYYADPGALVFQDSTNYSTTP